METGFLFVLVIGAALYFVPAILAFTRGHHQRFAIAALNLFLGWSVLFWVVSLVWALSAKRSATTSLA